ncbi:DUF1349 domain-containing protein [Cognatishimia maritima]|uniref:DUF1349 domain-containing protein n=1 Tax=Cognatishimia maritima TaxID=870908 RepID=A0A1M5JCK8_9RHOB|nr:DUF1349 domain-containing protein [Cognatishimia maritima]SHG37753.1 Protein of unknown function [Cognatishimia maritima]
MKVIAVEHDHLMDWSWENGVLQMSTNAQSNHFVDPGGSDNLMAVPVVYFALPDGDFSVSCRVAGLIAHTFDAAGFFLRCGKDWTAKFLAERAPTGEVMAVSVITTAYSDDCNGPDLPLPAQLRVTKAGQTVSWHIQIADGLWRLVRYAHLPVEKGIQLGLMVQTPSGGGVDAQFDNLSISTSVPKDLRNGS